MARLSQTTPPPVGTRSRAMLSLMHCAGELELQSEELSSAFGSRVTFSLRGQRESNPRERPPRFRALRASCPQGSRAGYGVFRQHILCWRKTGRHPCRPPCGLSFARPPLQRGPRVERRASCAHSSEEPDQERGNSGAAFCCGCCFSLHHRVRATMARCSTRGPLRGGESGSTGRAAGVARDGNAFSPGQDALSKSPAPAHGLAGQDARQAPSGVPLSLVTFSRASERK